MRKLMLSIRQDKYESLMREANARNVTVQEFVRAVVIPEWIKKNGYAPLPAKTLVEWPNS